MEEVNKNHLKGIGYSLLFLLIYLLIQCVLGVAGSFVTTFVSVFKYGPDVEPAQHVLEYMPAVVFISEIVLAVIYFIWYYFGIVRKSEKNKNIDIKKYLFIIPLTIASHSFCSLISYGVELLSPESGELLNSIMNAAVGENSVIGYISVIIFAPVAEELAFRGVMFKKTKQYFSIITCIIINAVFFGIMHMNLLQTIYVIPMGLVFTYIAYKYDSVIPAIVAHSINNTLGMFIFSILGRNFSVIEDSIVFIVFTGLSIFVLKFLLKEPFKQEVTSEVPQEVTE